MAQSSNGRRSFSADFKARVARDALRETDTLKAVAARRGVHPSQVKEWRSRFEEGGKAAFRDGAKRATDQAATIQGTPRQDRRTHDGEGFFSRALGR